jgi:hypothetical protein
MIKAFKIEDLGYFLPNKYSNPDAVLEQLTDPDFVVETMWHKDMVSAILLYTNYWGDCWRGCFLVGDTFPPKAAIELREHVRRTMIKHNASRLHTESVSCDELTKWHEFLGFKYEGTREKMLNNCDYDMWAILRGVN